MMKDALKLGGILFLITAVCVGLLSVVNQITAPTIALNSMSAELESMKQLIVEADDFNEVVLANEGDITKIYLATKQSEIVGYVLNVMPNGYGGPIEILVGINNDLVVTGVDLLSHSETPGFGANASKPEFIEQYIGAEGEMSVTKNAPGAGEVQAITGATITSEEIGRAHV